MSVTKGEGRGRDLRFFLWFVVMLMKVGKLKQLHDGQSLIIGLCMVPAPAVIYR